MADENAREKRVKRVLYGSFIAVTAVFVFANIAQVSSTLYGGEPPKAQGACAAALAELVGAVETPDRERVWSRYAEGAKACEGDPVGADALAAAERYARAASRHRSDLGRVRRAAESFIR